MGLLDAFLQEPSNSNLHIAVRGDSLRGVGTAHDPLNAATRQGPRILATLTRGSPPADTTRVALVNTAPIRHGFEEGDMVMLAGVTGIDADLWNGMFGIFAVTDFSFKYFMNDEPDPLVAGNPTCARLTFPFDEIMREAPTHIRIELGAGTFQTRGFAPRTPISTTTRSECPSTRAARLPSLPLSTSRCPI